MSRIDALYADLCRCGHASTRHPNYAGHSPYPCLCCECPDFFSREIRRRALRRLAQIKRRAKAR